MYLVDAAKPGADLLYGAAAALAAYSEARSGELATRAAAEAQALFEEGKAQEGHMYSDSIPELKEVYESVQSDQYGFLAAAWLFRTTKDVKYKAVRSSLSLSLSLSLCAGVASVRHKMSEDSFL